jgi:hypothetical protein
MGNNIHTNKWALAGALTLILGGIGHFVIVDLSAIFLEAAYVNWLPYSLINQMKQSTIDFGILGSNNAFRIFSGFSMWMAFSLIMLGVFNILILQHLAVGHKLRKQYLILSLIVTVFFLILASTSFIYPAAIGGMLAAIFFAIGIRNEKQD